MFVLRGLRFDSLQETHVWHVHRIDPKDVDLKLAVLSKGTDKSRFTPSNASFLFHAPIFGGWKNFGVYEVDSKDTPFHIGWAGINTKTGKLEGTAVHLLPIYDNKIRMLDGPQGSRTHFFAFDTMGNQIPLRKIGSGRLDDGTYLNVRIF